MVSYLARGRFGGWANRLERFAATFACRAAVKAGQALDQRSMRELLDQLFACELPPHDVHGRSTIVQLPRDGVIIGQNAPVGGEGQGVKAFPAR